MPRKQKRKPNRTQRQKRREEREQLEFEVIVEDTASTYTCSEAMATDLAWQCEHAMEEMEGDVFFNQLALDIWRNHADKAPELIRALTDLMAERERHRVALLSLKARFTALEENEAHEHLEPEESYIDFVRERLIKLETQSSQPAGEESGRLSNSNGS